MSDDEPKKSKVKHEIGEPLDYMSVIELSERLKLLKEEIERIEIVRTSKKHGRSVAESFFNI